MKNIALLVASIGIIFQIPAMAQQDNKYSKFITKAKQHLTADFKDPSSAQYRNIAVYTNGEKLALCGEVNGKNGYGAYVGFRPFYSTDSHSEVMPDGESIFDVLFRITCVKKLADAK